MKLRILGIHNIESKHTLLPGYVVDDVLALDAGSISRSLSFAEQRRIRAILVSHHHNDHVRDLPAIRHNINLRTGTLDVYGLSQTLDQLLGLHMLESHFSLHKVETDTEFTVGSHTIRAFRVPHAVPCIGYNISDGNASLFYTGDTGVGLGNIWREIRPDALLVEVTYNDKNREEADRQGHLTPSLLGTELKDFRSTNGYTPKVVVTHIRPECEQDIRSEIIELAKTMDADITIGSPNETMSINSIQN